MKKVILVASLLCVVGGAWISADNCIQNCGAACTAEHPSDFKQFVACHSLCVAIFCNGGTLPL